MEDLPIFQQAYYMLRSRGLTLSTPSWLIRSLLRLILPWLWIFLLLLLNLGQYTTICRGHSHSCARFAARKAKDVIFLVCQHPNSSAQPSSLVRRV
ncbi:uncharacterized protein BDV17DRAFT_271276 [Aspergillus undulatus]|uniref:uncharacterized protein n=1 Tax=Aspergillus undulatus TaxID=1810928 RepID=UPI003CCD4E48